MTVWVGFNVAAIPGSLERLGPAGKAIDSVTESDTAQENRWATSPRE
jgi:hypothetical protein